MDDRRYHPSERWQLYEVRIGVLCGEGRSNTSSGQWLESAVGSAQEQKGLVGTLDLQRGDPPQNQTMVSCRNLIVERTVDPHDAVIKDRVPGWRQAMRHALKLVAAPCGKLTAKTQLMAADDIHAKLPQARILGQLVEPLSGKKPTNAGSSDIEVNDPTAMPNNSPSALRAVMMQTPVG